MNNFYVSMIFIGIVLIMASLIWVAFEKKGSFSFMKKLEEKKQDMVSIINDAEQMIEELNKFSDYIVTQMDVKNEELRNNLKTADEEIKQLHSRIVEQLVEVPEKIAAANENRIEVRKEATSIKVVNGICLEAVQKPSEQFITQNSDLVIESAALEQAIPKRLLNSKQAIRRNDKVIPIDGRYKEVLRLSGDGFNDTEIAKKLSMGKGEIQLILEINKS